MRLVVLGTVALAGSVQDKPVGVEAESVKLTGLLKPPTGETVIVEVPEAPASISVGVTAPAEIVKPTLGRVTVTMIVVLLEMKVDSPTPSTVTM